jgi:hypothetical protein
MHTTDKTKRESLISVNDLLKEILGITVKGDCFGFFKDKHINIKPLTVYSVGSWEYMVSPILNNYAIFALPLVDYDLNWRWPLLFHEVGHVVWSLGLKNEILNKFEAEIRQKLASCLVGSREEISKYHFWWSQHWLKELFADIVGISLGSYAYTKLLVHTILSAQAMLPGTHPPIVARVYVQLRSLEKMGLDGEVKIFQDQWGEIVQRVGSNMLVGPFDPVILDFVTEICLDKCEKFPVKEIKNKGATGSLYASILTSAMRQLSAKED